ncbi:MAG: mechanosensitive ion channel [Desulfatiglandaceae bacterium]
MSQKFFKYRTVLNITLLLFLLFLSCLLLGTALAQSASSEEEKKIPISLSGNVGEAMAREAGKVRAELERRAYSIFEREPLGWNLETVRYMYREAISLPAKIPDITRHIAAQGRVLGFAGSMTVFVFIVAVLYSLIWRKRIYAWTERKTEPLLRRLPDTLVPYVRSGIKVVTAALLPLILLSLFLLVEAMVAYRAAWFSLTGRLLGLWAVGSLVLNVLSETLTGGLFTATASYGVKLYRWASLVVWYVLIVIGVFWAAESFDLREDVLMLIKWALSITIVAAVFQLLLKKKALFSLLPSLPYAPYKKFIRILTAWYYPLLGISLLAALLWCFGYRNFGRIVLHKIWFTGAAFMAIMVAYHLLSGWLKKWRNRIDSKDEAARLFISSLKTLLIYTTVLASFGVVLNLLGLADLVKRLMSFPLFHLGENVVSLWIIVNAVLILLVFVFGTRLVQSYLDYKVYPSLGIDQGLGYALNTFLKYFLIVVGFLFSLKIVGIDLRFLLVFAGAIGIGLGLGLQNMAANMISGFSIIFGGKIRKGDWIESGGTLGVVTDIYLRATKVRTRDNIEYLIPNSELISNTIVNYSLSSPMVRLALPLGVSYSADTRQVEKILLAVAEAEPLVSDYQKPVARLVGYGDSSIDFELLIWFDVRNIGRRKIRSALYFAIFDEFKEAGIEIPFPQRDIHIRSTVGPKLEN